VAVVIRLKRMGKENAAFYRIVVADERRSAKGGMYIEELGHYNPVKNPAIVKLDNERAAYWVSKGAKVSPTMSSILKKNGVVMPVKARKVKKEKKEKKAKKAAK
jgi:small subunit ribosomal protein S16